jgi:outer membrane lipoprotein SlyB
MAKNPLAILTAWALLALACAPVRVAQGYPYYQSGLPLHVERGTVERARPVKIQGLQTGAGAAAGMTAGMIAGSAFGQGYGTDWAILAGAILGGLLGAAAEQSAAERDGIEVAVQLEDGRRVVVVQEAYERFDPGDEVELLTAPDGTARVQHPPRDNPQR